MAQRAGQSGAGMLPQYPKIKRVYRKVGPADQLQLFQRVEIHLRRRLDDFVQSGEVKA